MRREEFHLPTSYFHTLTSLEGFLMHKQHKGVGIEIDLCWKGN